MRRFALAIPLTILGLAIFTPAVAQALWAEPSCDPSVDPTTCNISAPLNVSSVAQTKAGALTITGALTANGAVTINGTGSTFNSTAIFNNGLTYTSTAANLNFTASSIEDADVSNTLTASMFVGTGSTSNAVDLNTAEVANEQWVNTTGDTMTGALTMSTGTLGTPAISITQPTTQSAISISGASGSPSIVLNPTGGTGDGIEITLGTGTAGRNLDLYATGSASGNIISVTSSTTTAAAYPITVSATGATRSINVTNAAVGGYGVYANATNAGGGIGVAGTGLTYGVAGTTTTGYGLYGRATSTGYAGYFDSSTTAGTGVYITLSSGATTTASKALEVAGKNGYGGYFTSNGTASTALYAENTNSASGTVKYGIQVSATTPSGVGIQATSQYGQAGKFISTAGGTGIVIDTDGNGKAIDTDGGIIDHPGMYQGGQFYPNENAGNGVTPNVLPDYVDAVSLTSGYTTTGLTWDGTQLWASRRATFPTNGVLENINAVNSQLLDDADIGFSLAGRPIYAPGYGSGDYVWVFSTSADNYFRLDRLSGTSSSSSVGFTATTGYPQVGVYDGQNIWFGTTRAITELSSTGVLFNRVSSTGNISDIIYADGYIWAADDTNNVVHKVDTDTYTDTQITVGADPSGLVYDGAYVWVTSYSDSDLTSINTADNSTETYELSSLGTGPNDVMFDGTNLWIAFENSGIGYFNVGNLTVGESDALLGVSLDYLAFDGTNIWGGDDDSNSVLKIPTGTGYGTGDPAIKRGLLMYNTSGNLRCLSISGTTVSASSTLTDCQ